jgi:hypothetical protein
MLGWSLQSCEVYDTNSRHNTLHCNGTDHDVVYNCMLAVRIPRCFFNCWLRVQLMILLRTCVNFLFNSGKNLQTFLMEGQSVNSARSLRGDNVPITTAFILASTSVKSGDVMRTTKSAVVLSDTPYRLIASVILQNWS